MKKIFLWLFIYIVSASVVNFIVIEKYRFLYNWNQLNLPNFSWLNLFISLAIPFFITHILSQFFRSNKIQKIILKLDSTCIHCPPHIKKFIHKVIESSLVGEEESDKVLAQNFFKNDGTSIYTKINSLINNETYLDGKVYNRLVEEVLKKGWGYQYIGVWNIDKFSFSNYYNERNNEYININKFLKKIHEKEDNLRIFTTYAKINKKYIESLDKKFLIDVVRMGWQVKKIYILSVKKEAHPDIIIDGLIMKKRWYAFWNKEFVLKYKSGKLNYEKKNIQEVKVNIQKQIEKCKACYILKDKKTKNELEVYYEEN